MLAWQSLDRETRAWYDRYDSAAAQGWVSDAVSPNTFFGVSRLHKTEEEAAQRVLDFYQDFLRLRAKEQGKKMEIYPGSRLEQIIFEYLHLSPELIRDFIHPLLEGAPSTQEIPSNWNSLDEETLKEWKYRACLWGYYQKSLGEAQRLGYSEHAEQVIWPMGRPGVLCEVIIPDRDPQATSYPFFSLTGFDLRVIEAAQRYGLLVDPYTYRDPDLMWDLIAMRRDRDAVIFLAGDDRDYKHMIGVIWSPERLQRGNIPHAII